ncbi:hypothetical protein D9M68_665080 [compost metagenome]
MKSLSQYLRLPHVDECQCSVCWCRRTTSSLDSVVNRPHGLIVQHSPDCTPAGRPYLQYGRWWAERANCVCHLAPRKSPAPYWMEVENRGKPVPFVPIHEPFIDGGDCNDSPQESLPW